MAKRNSNYFFSCVFSEVGIFVQNCGLDHNIEKPNKCGVILQIESIIFLLFFLRVVVCIVLTILVSGPVITDMQHRF